MKLTTKVMKYAAISTAFLSISANAQVYEFGQTNAYNMPGGGQIQKISTGETWNWTISGNGGNHVLETVYGTESGQKEYSYELSFDKPFDLEDFSFMRLFSNVDTGDISARIQIAGGTASTLSISSIADGSYNANTGVWTRIDDPNSGSDNHSWNATGSKGTFTSLRFSTSGLQDRVATNLRIGGFVAVPEPSSTALLGLSLIGFVLRRSK